MKLGVLPYNSLSFHVFVPLELKVTVIIITDTVGGIGTKTQIILLHIHVQLHDIA